MLTLQRVLTKPFSSYIIVENNAILYYTQSFGELAQLNPSQSAPPFSSLNYQNMNFTLVEDANTPYNVYYSKRIDKQLPFENIWAEDLIHELRTASLLMGLGTRLLTEKIQTESSELFRILSKASHRQELSTLIASDFIQLLSIPPEIERTSLSKVISRGWSSVADPSRIRYHTHSGNKLQGSNFNPNPIIYGNEHFLVNFFSTTLSWFEKQLVTIEMEQINHTSCKISFCIPFEDHLSSLMSYRLINHYFQYIAAYFNFRVYLTQSTLNLILPLVN